MKLIDFHAHVFPDKIAATAISKLSESAASYGMKPCTDGTQAATRRRMEEWGVSRAVICSVATNERQTKNVNDFAASFLTDDLFVPFASVLPLAESALSETDRIAGLGFHGIKIHPEYQNFEVADERAFPFYEKCERLGLIVIAHAGFDPAYPDRRMAPPRSIRIVAETFPKLLFVAAHGGGQLMWEESVRELSKTGVYVDFSCMSHCETALYKRVVSAFPEERMLFGTDCPWSSAPAELSALDKLGLPAWLVENIRYKNAERLLSL